MEVAKGESHTSALPHPAQELPFAPLRIPSVSARDNVTSSCHLWAVRGYFFLTSSLSLQVQGSVFSLEFIQVPLPSLVRTGWSISAALRSHVHGLSQHFGINAAKSVNCSLVCEVASDMVPGRAALGKAFWKGTFSWWESVRETCRTITYIFYYGLVASIHN